MVSTESEEAGEILDALRTHGVRVAGIDRRKAFEDVRCVPVAEGEVLVEAGSPPAFVYVALDCSLRVERLGGYHEIQVNPWIPIGVTGVVRRAERNSTVVAAEPGEVLMIPGELFAREWFRPYEEGEFAEVLADIAG
jgi:CRP-like cAMP-binding protein